MRSPNHPCPISVQGTSIHPNVLPGINLVLSLISLWPLHQHHPLTQSAFHLQNPSRFWQLPPIPHRSSSSISHLDYSSCFLTGFPASSLAPYNLFPTHSRRDSLLTWSLRPCMIWSPGSSGAPPSTLSPRFTCLQAAGSPLPFVKFPTPGPLHWLFWPPGKFPCDTHMAAPPPFIPVSAQMSATRRGLSILA